MVINKEFKNKSNKTKIKIIVINKNKFEGFKRDFLHSWSVIEIRKAVNLIPNEKRFKFRCVKSLILGSNLGLICSQYYGLPVGPGKCVYPTLSLIIIITTKETKPKKGKKGDFQN